MIIEYEAFEDAKITYDTGTVEYKSIDQLVDFLDYFRQFNKCT